MKLSQLVAYLNQIEKFDLSQARPIMAQHFDPLVHTIGTHKLQFNHITNDLHRIKASINQSILDFEQSVTEIKREIKHNIELLEPQYLQESYHLYSKNMVNDSNELMLSRRPVLSTEVTQYLVARLRRHGDWHYPAMIIRPGLETWIHELVALDPLYLVDVNLDMLTPCIAKFNPEYQNRLRRCVIQESPDAPMLNKVPQNQMALILAYNYFHFKPLELIRSFLGEIFNCLRPGGTAIFTFNNCDRYGGVDLAERYFMCYTPGRLVLAAAEMIGYEIDYTYDIDAAATWVELKRPGELSSYRGGQTLARIIAKSRKSLYTTTQENP